MVENSEVVKLPLFDQAAAVLRETGVFRRELTSEELADIMSGIVSKLTEGQDVVRATIPSMNVKIEKAKGTVAGAVRVEKPIQATIRVNCALDNEEKSDSRIKLANLNIEQEAGFAAKLALKAVNIEGKAREALKDPNEALRQALVSQLEPRGVRLTGVGLHFND